jgi:predicted nuclease of restriction endonuclease-like (RecB) superfamily
MKKTPRKKAGKPSRGKVSAARRQPAARAALARTRSDAGVGALFKRIVSILERARGEVARSLNTQTVIAYWLIGREIVEAFQGGLARAKYGEHIVEELSRLLASRYGKGFSLPNLKNFRQFYLTYADRRPEIGSLPGSQSRATKSSPSGSQLPTRPVPAFHPMLSWSHYRALMRVEKPAARAFYEEEAVACGWSKADLERQIASLYHDRLLMSRDKRGMLRSARTKVATLKAVDAFKDPYVLEFLDLPDLPSLHESELESAILAKLQGFLLELGKGFAFVARQKRMRLEDEDFYVDLVFYNYLMRCFVLIDLKVGKLTHQDVGQMDSYVRMFEAHEKLPDDHPTIGLILCSTKNEAIVKYSILAESRQIFAARYLTYLPTEDELRRELECERRRLEERTEGGQAGDDAVTVDDRLKAAALQQPAAPSSKGARRKKSQRRDRDLI